ncbi:MAG: hypothetical protein JWP89_1004 [Schlesneria sp.]|nr:hypothetical protein [Schlesneria sp.]
MDLLPLPNSFRFLKDLSYGFPSGAPALRVHFD